jgi:hypothetical protein
LNVLTEGNDPYTVSVIANYSVDLTLDGAQKSFSYGASPNPYLVSVSSDNIGGVFNIDLSFG